MISPDEWQRMSWYARQRYTKRVGVRPLPVQNPVRVRLVDSFEGDSNVSRCVECGAWMIDACKTDHGRRYEP